MRCIDAFQIVRGMGLAVTEFTKNPSVGLTMSFSFLRSHGFGLIVPWCSMLQVITRHVHRQQIKYVDFIKEIQCTGESKNITAESVGPLAPLIELLWSAHLHAGNTLKLCMPPKGIF